MGAMFRLFRNATVACLAGWFVVSAAAQQANAPSPLAAAVAATRAAKADYAFDRTIDSSKQNWRAHFDPQVAAPKLRLVSPTRESLDGGQRRAFDGIAQHMEGVSWCASENIGRSRNVRLVRDEGATAVYAFQPVRDPHRGGASAQFVDRMRGEFTFVKADNDIGAIRMFITEPFSPIPLSRLDAVDIAITCTAAPNGRRYVSETVSNLRGSALGQNFNERSVQRTLNLRAP